MKKTIGLSILVLCVGSLSWWLFQPERVEIETAFVEKWSITEYLASDGYFRSLDRRTLTAFADGEIESLVLKQGDPVKDGQVITRILWDVAPEPLLSPLSGVVSRVWRETAGPVRRGDPLIEIIDPKRLEIVAEILTSDAARIRPGQSATVKGFGSRSPLPARVKRLSRAAFIKVSALGVDEERTEVILEPLSSVSNLAPWTGNLFHTEVNIETARVEHCLKVPIGSLVRSGGDWSVFIVRERRAHRIAVARGIDDGHWVEILAGLSGTERVILYPEDRVREGVGVKLSESGGKR